MEKIKGNRNIKLLTGVLAALLLLSVAGNIYYWDKNNDLEREKQNVDQQANALLSAQNRDLDLIKSQLQTAQEKNDYLNGEVSELNDLLSQVNTQIWQLRTRKASNAGNLDMLRNRSQFELNSMSKQADQLAKDKGWLIRQNDLLSQQLATLQDSLQTLAANVITADGFRMVAFKSNNKETAKAKKVDRFTVSLDVPGVFGLEGREMLYLSLTDIQGNGITPPLEIITISTPEEEISIPVHDSKVAEFGSGNQMHTVTFDVYRTENVKPGRYRASVYTKDQYLGSVELQFRDSFWFF